MAIGRDLRRFEHTDVQRLVTDVEVLQEILHRYAAVGKQDAIAPALQLLLDVIDDVLPIEKQT